MPERTAGESGWREEVDLALFGDRLSELTPLHGGETLESPPPVVDAEGRIDAPALLRAVGSRRRSRPLLVVTDRPLTSRGCRSLVGLADRRRRVAVVSTATLADPLEPERLVPRLENAIAHELGHLSGLGHCSGDCLMRPASAAHELDERPRRPCGRCPRSARSRPRAAAAALAGAAVLLVSVWALDRAAARFSPDLEVPFT
jgi:hypothetical protein